MKEQFDKKLVEKIKASFEQHQEPYNPREWDKFSKAYFKPKRKPIWVYWPVWVSGIAASLLLLFVLWPVSDQLEEKVYSLADTLSLDSSKFEVLRPSDDASSAKGDKLSEALSTLERGEQISETDFPWIATLPDGPSKRGDLFAGESKSIHNQIGSSKIDTNVPASNLEQTMEIQGLGLELPYPDVVLEVPILNLGASILAQDETDAQDWINKWKSEDVLSENQSLDKNNSNPMRLGVMVSPQAASTAVSGMNFGAGIMSEFSFSRRLKLDVGLAYARQNLVANEFTTTGRNLSVNLPQDQMVPIADANVSAMGSSVYRANSLTNNLIRADYELSFANLDIPVNLKYKVVDKANSGLFVMTGLSSMIYLNQSTTGTFNTNAFALSSQEASSGFTQVQQFSAEFSPVGNESSVDLGRMLNLSIGYEYSLKNGTFLSIEPFYKLPMGNMTFAEQQFSIGGLNLRMNFQLKK
ncbi:outer membrane beta-barrel protein [Pararhodonellum marinum]|uniref:outer membrane beta-barrel protein n=1 Tax=Pararhodonellum marinum TaxID=2755358 RepID=UPI00188E2F8D|nr:outer membrane beta-barrel protein [Pararhodonellum marinum]